MPVKPESHHHTCPGSTDHHCPGCCSCECCGGYRKYYLPPPDDQPMDLSDHEQKHDAGVPDDQPMDLSSDDASTWNTPSLDASVHGGLHPTFPPMFSSPQQQGSRGIAGGGFGHQLPQQQQQRPSNSLFSSPQQQQPFAGFGSPQHTGGSMFGQYPCKMAGCDKRFTSMNSMVKH